MTRITECPACQRSEFVDLIRVKAQMHPSEETFQFQQCTHCQLVFLNPRVPPTQLKEYYTDFYLPYRGPEAWGRYRKLVTSSLKKLDQKRAAFVHQYHPLDHNTKILDVGCGKPTFLKTCRENFSCKTIGLDFSDEGWKANPEAFKDLNLQIGEVKDLTPDIAPQVISMWHYLEHDYSPAKTLSALREIATPQTSLIIEVPNYESDSRKKYGKHWAGYHTPRHTFLFSPENIKMLLENTGWRVEIVNTFGTMDPYIVYWMSEMEKKEIDWSKSMQSEFFGYLMGMIRFLPNRINAHKKSHGIMTIVARSQ